MDGNWVPQFKDKLSHLLWEERPQWFLWLPVCVGLGVWIYFALPFEPIFSFVVVLFGISSATALWLYRRVVSSLWILALLGVYGVTLGFTAASWRTHRVEAPVLAKEMGPVWLEGTVAEIEPLPKGMRLTLENIELDRPSDTPLPHRVRLKVWSATEPLQAHDQVRLLATLTPPPAPSIPGGYDFQRHLYFQQIGALGYSLKPAEKVAAAPHGWRGMIQRWRITISQRILDQLEMPAAGVAVALITGDKTAIPKSVRDNMRDVGLAHLLAISGLHMTLVCGFVFLCVRFALLLIPSFGLGGGPKKIAAIAALVAGGFYVLLAGMPVPTQRAFIMIAIVFLGVLTDRLALSLRLVAVAALVVLLWHPEVLMGASFQLSFAAVVTLVAGYEYLRKRTQEENRRKDIRGILMVYITGIISSTLLAEAATTPIALYHFHMLNLYGMLGNMVAIPLTGFWIMPWGLVACLLMPFGLEGWALEAMGWGIEIVVESSQWISSLPHSVTYVPAFSPWGLALLIIGGLWLCLWKQRWRWWGFVPLFGAVVLMIQGQPLPDIFVDDSAKLFAIYHPDHGLVVSDARKSRFERDTWLSYVGESRYIRLEDAKIPELQCDNSGCLYTKAGQTFAIAITPNALHEDCQTATHILSLRPNQGFCERQNVTDFFDLWQSGGHAFYITEGNVKIKSVNGERSNRPWVLKQN